MDAEELLDVLAILEYGVEMSAKAKSSREVGGLLSSHADSGNDSFYSRYSGVGVIGEQDFTLLGTRSSKTSVGKRIAV